MSTSEQKVLFVFPGQGSQYKGMGGDLFKEYETARKVYVQASDALGYDVAELSFEDPLEQLNQTRFTQPALLTHSIACLEVFRELTEDRLKPSAAAGHSLGEYSALVAAKALSFQSALKLVQKRGELMGTYGEGEMSAFPLNVDIVRPIAEKFHCAIAGCNLPDQTVIGGRGEDLELVEQQVQEQFERKSPVRLKTEGAFHTYYMVEAARHYRGVLDSAGFDLSDIQVLSNFTGSYHEPDPAAIKACLFFQLFHPVLWFSNLQTAFNDGGDVIIEFGGGIGFGTEPEGKRPNLAGIIKKTQRATGHKANYMSAINCKTLTDTVDAVLGG
ncbi:MAG: ACP S-malonyltransferase [Xanthomonadales bacterium]|nr:ACP S-malonyltransferase [Xanthomonadales bacterium]